MKRIEVGFIERRKAIEIATWSTENPTLPLGYTKTVVNKYRKEHKSHSLTRQQK